MHTSVSELLWGLHWLPIRVHIKYTVPLIVINPFNSSKPHYLSDMLISTKQMRAANSSLNILNSPKTCAE